MERGIVVGQPFWAGDKAPVTRALAGESLHRYLLYWDKIDYPAGVLLEKTEHNPDIQFLSSEGVLKRTVIEGGMNTIKILPENMIKRDDGKFTSKHPIHAYVSAEAQLNAFKINNNAEPGVWAMAQDYDAPLLPGAEEKMGIEFDLYNALPVPDYSVSLDDILSFKIKRKSELMALRSSLDNIHRHLLSAPDYERERQIQFHRLESNIRDITNTLNESTLSYVCRSMKTFVSANLDGVSGIGLGAAGISSNFNISPINGGIVAAGIYLVLKKIVAPSSASVNNPYMYIERVMHREI